jgi:hypothetical protein
LNNKYIIIKIEIAHKPDTKVILFDNWFWHENFNKDYEIHSSGFFNMIADPFEKYGFRVICGGDNYKQGDEGLIKKMLIR